MKLNIQETLILGKRYYKNLDLHHHDSQPFICTHFEKMLEARRDSTKHVDAFK